MRLFRRFCSIALPLLWSLVARTPLYAQPSVISVAPSSGTGFTQTFSLVSSDTGGWANLQSVQINFSSPLSGANACYVGYSVAGNWFVLLNDAGNAWTSSVTLG